MLEKIMQRLDRNGMYTLYGVYEGAKDSMDKDLRALPIGVSKVKKMTWRMFSKIMRMYFVIMFRELIKGYSFTWLNKFGVLRVVKTMITRYNPITYRVYQDENGKPYSEKVKFDTNKYGGYWHFIFWDVGKKWRQYRFVTDAKFKGYKKGYMAMVDQGFEYLDYSLFKDGRYASDTYIHKVR